MGIRPRQTTKPRPRMAGEDAILPPDGDIAGVNTRRNMYTGADGRFLPKAVCERESEAEAPKAEVHGPTMGRLSKGKASRKISTELYNRMLQAYLEKPTIYNTVETCGVGYQSAKKIIEHGDPDQGFPPLKQRLQEIRRAETTIENYDIARARVEFQRGARGMLVKILKRIQSMQPDELTADKIPENLNKLFTVIERTLGGAEHTHEVQGAFMNWSRHELEAYIQDGIAPEK